MSTGVFARATLIACIYERGAKITGKERVKLTNAALVNYISTDVSCLFPYAGASMQYFIGEQNRFLCTVVCEWLFFRRTKSLIGGVISSMPVS